MNSNTRKTIAAYAGSRQYEERLLVLARHLGIPMLEEAPSADDPRLILRLDEAGLALTGSGLLLRGDFSHMLPRLRTANLRGELLVRASGINKMSADRTPSAIDATAGLGEDSLLLAAAGFSVQLFEYNPVISALLQDALQRASDIPELADTVRRMHSIEADSVAALAGLPAPPDLILLDPMFPARQKSALVKKKFQLLQCLEQPCTDEAALLRAAMDAQPRRIVIKRPARGPYLAGVKPSFSIQGKGIRYDCIM